MSNRLESLNLKKRAPKAGLKFKPKAVARKSKEDRDRDAPEVKLEHPQRQTQASRGRGSGRGRGRGHGRAYGGTYVVSAGPLAMGSVGVGNGTTSTKTGLTSDQIYTSGELQSTPGLADLKLKLKHGPVKSLEGLNTRDDSDSDDENHTRINMNKEYAFEDLETVLFPVRPQKTPALMLQSRLVLDTTQLPLESPISVSQNVPRAHTADSVKSKDRDGVTPAEVSGVSGDVPVAALFVNPDEQQESDEHDRIIDDQKLIIDMITLELDSVKTGDGIHLGVSKSAGEKYMLIHVPQIIPKMGENSGSSSHYASKLPQNFEGQIGTLNFHQSGKITMNIGQGLVFQCAGGNPSSFLQELYVIDDNNAVNKPEDINNDSPSVVDAEGRKIAGRIYRLSEITCKIVATPMMQ